MIKKIALPLFFVGGLSLSSVALAGPLYGGLGVGFSLTDQNQGTLDFNNGANLPIEIKSKAGSLSGSGFFGISPAKFLSIEGDFEYTEIDNEIKRPDEVDQAIYGNKPITTTILTPLLNVVIKSGEVQGAGLFVMAGIGGSYMKTKVSYDTTDTEQTYSKFTRAYDLGGGIFYRVPESDMALSLGFRYINLGGTFEKKSFNLKATSKEELFLRLNFGF